MTLFGIQVIMVKHLRIRGATLPSLVCLDQGYLGTCCRLVGGLACEPYEQPRLSSLITLQLSPNLGKENLEY
jgi:hypothetical protein